MRKRRHLFNLDACLNGAMYLVIAASFLVAGGILLYALHLW